MRTILNGDIYISSEQHREAFSNKILEMKSSFRDLRDGKLNKVPTLAPFVLCLALKANCKKFVLVFLATLFILILSAAIGFS